jgi:hypothetical protein
LYAKRPPLFRGSGPFRVLTPGSFILGRLMMLWSLRLPGRPLPQYSEENLEFCLEGKGYPIGLLLAAQGSDFIQALEGFGGKSAG